MEEDSGASAIRLKRARRVGGFGLSAAPKLERKLGELTESELRIVLDKLAERVGISVG